MTSSLFLLSWFPHKPGLGWVGGGVGGHLLRLFLALCRYSESMPGIAFLGDNTASLQMSLSGKAKQELGALARELFLRKARHDWHYQVGHLPSEHNNTADYLSRLAQPGAPSTPPIELKGAAEVTIPDLSSYWVL